MERLAPRLTRSRLRLAAAVPCVLVAAAGCSRLSPTGNSRDALVTPQARDAALARARVWREPDRPIEAVDLSTNPPGPFRDGDDVTCTFVADRVGGTTPKFHCRTPNGAVLKVKYGPDNPELPAETAASRLLLALGFPVDHLFRVRSVRCLGCPPDPFGAMRCAESGGARERCFAGARTERAVVFDAPTIEQRFDGRAIDSTPDQGWSWFELDRIDPSRGGSPRAEVDALRLMAVLLAHWDNKGPNQRLLCPAGAPTRGETCAAPLAIVQDLGATFGPLKLDLPNWQHTQIWADPRACVVSMKTLPYDGGTFGDHTISEGGRQLILRLLRRLSADQIRGLFAGSGATRLDQISAVAHDPDAWVRAFLEKVDAIATAGPCPR